MNHTLRKALYFLGLTIHRRATIPLGTDPFFDISNHFKGVKMECFFDIGANTGQTISRIKQTYPKSEIYAFEPINETFSKLKRNYGHKSNVHLESFGFGSVEETRIISLAKDSLWNSMKNLAHEGIEGSESVSLKSLDGYLKTKKISKIDFLKIDVEGFEIEVLKGAASSLGRKVIDFVFCEVGVNRNDVHHTPFFDVLEFLTPYGYRLVALYDHSLVNTEAHYANALFFNSNNLSFK